MKKQLITGGLVLAMTLVGCQADNEGARGTTEYNNNNVEPTRFHETRTGDGTTTRDYTLQRDADWFQNRDGNIGRNVNNNNNNRMNTNTRNINQNRVNDNRNENRYEVAEEAAERITDKVNEIDSAYVLTTENNAYVAAELDVDNDNNNNRNNRRNDRTFDDELSDDVKSEIADIVKSVDRDIDNVYVSTNPDFFNLSNNYVNDVDSGNPVEGFFDQFSNMVERLFPQNR